MIVDNAPDLLMFCLDKPLNEKEIEERDKLKNKRPLTPDEVVRLDFLNEQGDIFSTGETGTWIPVPIDPNVTGMQVSSFSSETKKRIKLVAGKTSVRPSLNTVTIEIVTVDSAFVSTMVNVADMIFNCDDSYPRVRLYSPQMVILAGRLLGFNHKSTGSDNKVVITLTIQRGTVEEESGRVVKKKVKQIFKEEFPPVPEA